MPRTVNVNGLDLLGVLAGKPFWFSRDLPEDATEGLLRQLDKHAFVEWCIGSPGQVLGWYRCASNDDGGYRSDVRKMMDHPKGCMRVTASGRKTLLAIQVLLEIE